MASSEARAIAQSIVDECMSFYDRPPLNPVRRAGLTEAIAVALDAYRSAATTSGAPPSALARPGARPKASGIYRDLTYTLAPATFPLCGNCAKGCLEAQLVEFVRPAVDGELCSHPHGTTYQPIETSVE